jgi:hypothetical protein
MHGRGGPVASNWRAFVLGLLLFAAIVAGTVEVMRRPRPTLPKVVIGAKDEVYYSRKLTAQDAIALGRALRNVGFFSDRGTSVLLSRSGGGAVVSFVLADGVWDRADAAANFEEVGRRIATSIGGFPIQVRLVDSAWTVRKSLEVGKTIIGSKDAIYYLGSATEGDARALGSALRDAGYLKDLGVSVVVSKGDGAAIGFVLSEGVWERPEAVAGFEGLARRVAASIGGLPVQVRLLSVEMETKKEVAVR